MKHPIAVLRPEPGNTATAAWLAAAGFTVRRLPLFEVRPIDWSPPDPADHDAIVFTSANALRHSGANLARYRHLPAFAVGAATAAAARAAGFACVTHGDGDGAALLALLRAHGVERALMPAGRDRSLDLVPPITAQVTVYAADPVAVAPEDLVCLTGAVALLHSTRIARRLADLVDDRGSTMLAAISAPVLAAAGLGWARAESAPEPSEAALLALAMRLAD